MNQRQINMEQTKPQSMSFSNSLTHSFDSKIFSHSTDHSSFLNSIEAISDYCDSHSSFIKNQKSSQQRNPLPKDSSSLSTSKRQYDCSKRTLIIVPGYSVDVPPRIGHHLYYINALKYHPQKNPKGYRRIYLFDIYSKKAGRCNFKASIPQLADELWRTINSPQNDWCFEMNGEVDFIGGSMGGLIIRKFINDHLQGENELPTRKWGNLHVKTILLIGTPNFGCKLVDRLQSPIIQLILRLWYGKNNFSTSQQLQQVRVGKEPVFGKILSKIFKKKTSENHFLQKLNQKEQTPGDIRWITVSGSKNHWYSHFLYSKATENDSVVESSRVHLKGAENIRDRDLGANVSWDHRDLYENAQFCKLLHGLLVNGLSLNEYLLKEGKTLTSITKKSSASQQFHRKTPYNSPLVP